jgi:Transposase IS116/IS110/IS902 family
VNKVSFKNLSRRCPLETFDEGVLNRLSRIDVMPIDLGLFRPEKDGVACELGAIVADNCLGPATPPDQNIEFAGDPEARKRDVGDDRQAFPDAVIEDGEDPEAPPADELVGNEIQRPPVVRSQGHSYCRSHAQSPLAAAAFAHHEPFLPLDAEKALVVYDKSFPAQEDKETAIAEAPALPCHRTQSVPQGLIIRPPSTVAHHHPVIADRLTRPPLAHPMCAFKMSDGLSLDHFFERRSSNAALSSSSIASANSFLSFVFSSSSAFSRFASETSRGAPQSSHSIDQPDARAAPRSRDRHRGGSHTGPASNPQILVEPNDELTGLMREIIESLYAFIMQIDKRIRAFDKEIDAIFKASEACRRIAKISGVGPKTATAMIAAIEDGSDFKSGRHLAAWLGLVPRQHSSGNRRVMMGISKRGSQHLRTLLVHGARAVVRTASRETDPRSNCVNELRQRRGYNRATVCGRQQERRGNLGRA